MSDLSSSVFTRTGAVVAQLLNGMIQRSDGAFIPSDPNNLDYQTYLAWKAAGGVPTQQTIPVQTSDQARVAGEEYVQQFFTLMEIQEMQLMLVNTATPATQLSMVQAVYSWLKTLEAAWLNPANVPTFNPATFGNPPYTYAQIITTTN